MEIFLIETLGKMQLLFIEHVHKKYGAVSAQEVSTAPVDVKLLQTTRNRDRNTSLRMTGNKNYKKKRQNEINAELCRGKQDR